MDKTSNTTSSSPDSFEERLHTALLLGMQKGAAARAPAMVEALGRAVAKRHKESFPNDSGPIFPLLAGEAGGDKAAIFQVVAKRVADSLGLRFVANPGPLYIASPADFVYAQMNFGAEHRPPSTRSVEPLLGVMEAGYAAIVADRVISLGSKAAGCLYALDEITEARPSVQQAFVGMLDPERLERLGAGHFLAAATCDAAHLGRPERCAPGLPARFRVEPAPAAWENASAPDLLSALSERRATSERSVDDASPAPPSAPKA